MFKIHEIREMIKLIDGSNVACLEIEEGDSKISIQRNLSINPSNLIENNSIKLAIPTVTENPAVRTETLENTQVSNQVDTRKERSNPVNNAPNYEGDENILKIVSPMVGTFYKAPAVDANPFVQIGDQVKKSTVVCILEAMKLFNEIEAEIDGEIVKVLIENGQLVEYGQPLFLVKQNS
ncbi:acetyl-CoA carboxylase biotin carboxyl carrier protein [Gottfriedia acidiceleris]|uniref:acetyl-CoA carboxylase biotin carboxyl carrier protein n=1 Tax=Gottfriedia acidiceleris TaxID=371036 RepID=UPI003D21C570